MYVMYSFFVFATEDEDRLANIFLIFVDVLFSYIFVS